MKKMLISMGLLVLFITVYGQAQESTIPQLSKATGFMMAAKIDLPYAPQVVIEVIKQYVQVSGKASQREAVGYKLSENTQLAKSNLNSADLHYFVQRKSNNPNETELYLNLQSYTQNKEYKREVYYFNLEDAKDYLNNLKMAVAHNATILQRQLQSDNLLKCNKRSSFLEKEANRLERQQHRAALSVRETSSLQKKNRQTQKLNALDQKVSNNRIMQANQKAETLRQTTALKLLVHPIGQ
jgi:hypothetical protein